MSSTEVSGRTLSRLDRKLIRLLTQNSRRSNTELAGLLGVSRMTVKNRIDGLIRRRVIERFTIEASDNNIGREAAKAAFFHLKLKRPFCKLVYETVQDWPELVGAWSIAGETDMTLLVETMGGDRLEELRDRLARHPHVATVSTAMTLRQWVHKSSFMPDYEPGRGPDGLDLRLRELGAEEALE